MGLKFKHGLAIGVLIPLGCASVPFPYKYYELDAKDYAGQLIGAKPSDDLPLSICEPTAQDKHPCMVLKTSEVLRMKADYKILEDELRACQSPKVSAEYAQ
jgi:hypothetical protein